MCLCVILKIFGFVRVGMCRGMCSVSMGVWCVVFACWCEVGLGMWECEHKVERLSVNRCWEGLSSSL